VHFYFAVKAIYGVYGVLAQAGRLDWRRRAGHRLPSGFGKRKSC